MAHPMPVVPGNPKPPTQRDVAVYSQFISQCCQAEHPALAVLSRPRLVLAEPVSPGSARGRPCCRGTALWISEPKKNRKKIFPSSPKVFLLHILEQFGASHKTPVLMSLEPQAAPESLVPAPGGLCCSAECRRSVLCTQQMLKQ